MTKAELQAENARMRRALEDVLRDVTNVGHDAGAAHYTIGKVQAAACHGLGLSWDEWRRTANPKGAKP
jgi:hypothetical protein